MAVTPYQSQRLPWHEDLTVRGLRHRLTWWGERTENPIVLLHGYQDCGATWQFLVDCLPAAWSLVAPDWRGFGHSEWAPGAYWYPDYFADLEALLETLVPHAKAKVVGHSMGANVAFMYGGIRPRRLAWLVNLEGLGLPRAQPQDAPKRYERWLDQLRKPLREGRFRSVSELAAVLQSRNPRLTPDRAQFVAQAWSQPAHAGNQESLNASSDARRPSDGEVELLFDPRHRLVNPMLYRREEAEACWARVEAPVLLVTGEASEHHSRHGSDATDSRLGSLVRNLRIVTIADAGHMMHHEAPAALARHIVEFDRECCTPPRDERR